MKIVTNLRNPKYLFALVGVAFVAFDLSYYLMASLPGNRDEMCIMGANLTPLNIWFSVMLSLMVGVLFAGFWSLIDKKIHLQKQSGGKKIAVGSLSGIGAFLGVMTMFCTACTLPVISLFGLSVGLEVFTDNNYIFKIASLVMVLVSIILLNRQLEDKCETCVYKQPV